MSHNALTGKDLFRTVLLILFLVALAYFFPYLPLFALMVLVAGLIAISLSDGARLLERVGVPRRWGVTITLIAAISVFMSTVLVLSSPFYAQLKNFLAALPEDLESARPYFKGLLEGPLERAPLVSTDFFSVLADWFSANAALFDLNLPALFPPVGTLVWDLVSALIILMVLLVTGVYLAMTPVSLLNAFLRLFNKRTQGRASKVLKDLYEGLHTWPVVTLLSMAAVGLITSFAYWAIGLPSALLLGVIAGLLEIVPYFGPVIAAILAILTAATESLTLVFLTLLTIIVVQTINRNVVILTVMSRAVRVHPAVVALSVIPIYWVFGILGLFLVVPICVVGKILIQDLWIECPTRRKQEVMDRQSVGARR